MSAAVSIAGELTVFTAGEIHQRFLKALGMAAEGVEIDLSGVTEIDSAGQQLLLAAEREAVGHRGGLSFSDPSPVVVDLLALCDLTGHFGIPPPASHS